jgi:hypothetical protein
MALGVGVLTVSPISPKVIGYVVTGTTKGAVEELGDPTTVAELPVTGIGSPQLRKEKSAQKPATIKNVRFIDA